MKTNGDKSIYLIIREAEDATFKQAYILTYLDDLRHCCGKLETNRHFDNLIASAEEFLIFLTEVFSHNLACAILKIYVFAFEAAGQKERQLEPLCDSLEKHTTECCCVRNSINKLSDTY